ncbi:hypothetical protein V3N99_22160 (plasmid) [Dermatophilaceae bacterium Soc4.6]
MVAFDLQTGDVELGTAETSAGPGDMVQTPTFGVSLSQQLSNVNQICQLGGPFAYGGGSVPVYRVISAGAQLFGGSAQGAPNNFAYGADFGVGVSIGPLPAEIHGGISNTKTGTDVKFNLFDAVKQYVRRQFVR